MRGLRVRQCVVLTECCWDDLRVWRDDGNTVAWLNPRLYQGVGQILHALRPT